MIHKDNEKGFAVAAVLILLAVGALIVAGTLQQSATDARTVSSAKMRNNDYYQAESAVATTVGWMREQSLNLITPFQKANFYNTFDRSSPSVGANDSGNHTVPTRLKLKNTNNSAILTNASALGSGNFPTTSHLDTGASYNPLTAFQGLDAGGALLRVTLVDAIALDPSKDYGPPPAAAPDTDFYPVYRVDSMTNTDQGARLYGYILGSLTYVDTVGFYGRDYVEARQGCDSYNSADGVYGGGNKRAKCPVGSNGEIRIHQNEQIYGSVRTNGSIVTSSPYGGSVCSDFASGCPNEGQKCEGPACGVPNLPTFQPWTTYCPSNQGDRVVSTNQTWTVAEIYRIKSVGIT